MLRVQLNQALAGKFNAHVHVEYEWRLQHEDLDESDEDLDEKVPVSFWSRGFVVIHTFSGGNRIPNIVTNIQ